MLVEPGFFRTELLTPESTQLRRVRDRGLRRAHRADRRRVDRHDGPAGRRPRKLADALVQLASADEPPLRWPAGADAVATFEQKAQDLLAQARRLRELSSSLAHHDA